ILRRFEKTMRHFFALYQRGRSAWEECLRRAFKYEIKCGTIDGGLCAWLWALECRKKNGRGSFCALFAYDRGNPLSNNKSRILAFAHHKFLLVVFCWRAGKRVNADAKVLLKLFFQNLSIVLFEINRAGFPIARYLPQTTRCRLQDERARIRLLANERGREQRRTIPAFGPSADKQNDALLTLGVAQSADLVFFVFCRLLRIDENDSGWNLEFRKFFFYNTL